MKYKMLPVVMLAVLAVCLAAVAVPGSDAAQTEIYIEDGSGTPSDPYSGVVFINPALHSLENVYVEVGSTVYVFVNTGYCEYAAWDEDVDCSTFDGYDNDLTDGSPDTVPGYGGTEYTVTSVLGVIPEGVTGINVGIYSHEDDHLLQAFGICVVAEDGTYSETADNDYSDYEGGDEGYSYWLAVIIISVVVLAIIWLIRKVR